MKTLIISFILFINCSLAQFCGPATFVGLLFPSGVDQITPPTGNGQRPYWKFYGSANCTYTFQTCGLTSMDTELEIIKTSSVYFNDDYCLLQSYINWECQSDGLYILFLTRYSGSTCKTLNQNISIKYHTNCINLPVELSSFQVRNEGDKNIINWSTASESNSDYFSVERHDSYWNEISKVAASGFSQSTIHYIYIDDTYRRGCVNYYRLRMVDYNGDHTISDIESIDNTSLSEHLVKVVNLEGKDASIHDRGVLILVYSNGTTKIINNF